MSNPNSTLVHVTGLVEPCQKATLQSSKQAVTRQKVPDPLTPAPKIAAIDLPHIQTSRGISACEKFGLLPWPCDLVIARGRTQAWTPARQPVSHPSEHESLVGDPGLSPQRAQIARRGPRSPTPASTNRSPGTPVWRPALGSSAIGEKCGLGVPVVGR